MSIFYSAAPFLAWAGGKRWFATRFPQFLPSTFNTYFEPFLGSGAVFFYLKPRKSYLSDVNADLVTTYNAIKDDPEGVLRKLEKHKRLHSDQYYYTIRAQRPVSASGIAARFIYLNRTCWNGLYRVNRRGEFNVPRGTKDQIIYPFDDFAYVSECLAECEISCRDFESSVQSARKGDFVFFDPPYTVKHNNNGFIKYNESIFTWKDQIRLREAAGRLAERGVKVLITNADHQSIHDLYSGIGQHHSVNRNSVLAADSSNRSGTSEFVITINYAVSVHSPKIAQVPTLQHKEKKRGAQNAH